MAKTNPRKSSGQHLRASRATPATPGVTAARGFRAAAASCGIRSGRPDLALVVSDRPAAAAAVFTRNLVQAAPIQVSRANLQASGGRARAILVNAGNANACTGEPGMKAAWRSVERLAELLDLPVAEVLVASTGVIGQQLPVERLLAGLPAAVQGLAADGGASAAQAILTTDTSAKETVRPVRSSAGSYVVGGMAKGSGMIHPNLATTLAFVTTDAAVEPEALQRALVRAADRSFNRISVDGDTSTNDTVAVLANGASGVFIGPAEEARFEETLTAALTDLARMVVRDGEGATKLITVVVTGARNEAEALQVGRTVAGSPLVRTAIHGADANWGRIVAAAGRAGVALDPARLRVALGPVVVLEPGYRSRYSEEEARDVLLRDQVTVMVDLGLGSARAETWTCDLTRGYIEINANYRS